ncbi:MAG: type II toxin-antitoxin system RelE/ParE family toxin [Bauldia sp.]|nr:type II toxin-antitoxin system RelE/ParE family toxin [Bauldia sp.]
MAEAAERAAAGLIDANLGKFLIKQRVPRLKGGKSGGFRAILFYRAEDMAVILYLFAKNERENLTAQELNIYRDVAQSIGRMTRRAGNRRREMDRNLSRLCA